MNDTSPLVVRSVSFYKSVKSREAASIRTLPEIAFAGKSNAGKSSLINYLCNRRRLAYTGKTPGKTRLINYFTVNDAFYLVDLPGYGFASVSHSESESWGRMMDEFFHESEKELCGLVLCTDVRRNPSEQDLQMLRWAEYYRVPTVIAATKADKIAKSKRPTACMKIAAFIADELDLAKKPPIVPISSTEGIGGPALLADMQSMLETGSET